MKRTSIILIVALCLALASALPALAAADMGAALDYLQTQQNADGGFGSGFSPESTVGSTSDVLLAIIAGGGDPTSFAQNGDTPVTYLAGQAGAVTTSGDLAKLILAAVAAGENPREFGGVDSVAKLEGTIGADGRIGTANDTFVSHLLGVLALASVRRPIPDAAISHIEEAQQENGGWAWDGTAETAADTNTTAFAVQALAAAGQAGDSEAIAQAIEYYRGIQNEDGGWPYQNPSDFGTDTDANSTALAIQAILAAGQDPADWTAASGQGPVAALEAFQNESGAFAWQAAMPDDNLLATVQALPALAGETLPLATMAVGAAAATPAAPETIPETGGPALGLALPLVLSGLALAAGGWALRRRQ
ncbi:MAG: cell wall anchor protein [Anaerolineae bacterium]|nr:cell wall anchor protein [Anaerolineae bacterium]